MDNTIMHETDFSLQFISKFCDKYSERGEKLDLKKKEGGWDLMVNTITLS